jgi:hypothetical protein
LAAEAFFICGLFIDLLATDDKHPLSRQPKSASLLRCCHRQS